MASPLDTSLLSHFEVIFPFLLVMVLTYGILTKINFFESKQLNGFISIIVAVMMLFSPIARETLNVAAPWFVLLFIFIIFTLVAYMALGAEGSDIHDVLTGGNYSYINIWIVALVLIIVFGSLFYVLANHGGVGKDLDVQQTAPGVSAGGSSESGSSDSGSSVASGTVSTGGVASNNQNEAFWTTLVHPKVLGLMMILLICMFAVQRLTKM